ncbi:MAG: hypothetical protein AAF211_30645, partial [Myxococcota bacterium]
MLLVLLAALAVANPLPTVEALLAMPDANARTSDPTRRRAAPDAVEAVGLPPAHGATTTTVDPARLEQYRGRALRLQDMTILEADASNNVGSNWTVYQGAEALKPRAFAQLVGDEAMEEQIRKG